MANRYAIPVDIENFEQDINIHDDVILSFGTDSDVVILNRSTTLSADAEVTNVIEGTSDHLGVAANSLVMSNITNDGDIMFVVSDGGHSKGILKLDGATGRTVFHGGDVLLSGAQKLYLFDVGGEYLESDGSTLTITGATSFSSTVAVGDDARLTLGAAPDAVFVHSTGAVSADAEVANVIVGTSQHLATAANSLIISNTTTDGDIAFFTSDNGNSIGTMVIKGAKGNVEFYNTVAGTQTLDVYNKGTASDNYLVIFNDVDSQVGSIVHDGSNSTAFNTSSDYRLKENAVTLSGAVNRVKNLKPYRFNFRSAPSVTKDGFFAHEAATVVPEAVSGAKDAVDGDNNPIIQGMDNSKLVPLLTAAIQELDARITTLES